MFKVLAFLLVLALVAQIESKKAKPKVKVPKEPVLNNNVEDKQRRDPCANLKCGPGRECIIDVEAKEAKCSCVKECAENTDVRRRVCSNHNVTWKSDCELFKHRCMCLDGLATDCTENHKHMHIDYYGECQELPACRDEVLEDFPRRMRDWLYSIMTVKAKTVSNGEDLVKKWVDAVIWKYCDLDRHPHDRTVSRHELFPLRAPLLSMEPCISNFLNNCDSNDDHKISLTEWGSCLGAKEEELEDKCNQFKALMERSEEPEDA